jgi:hypothetical protein
MVDMVEDEAFHRQLLPFELYAKLLAECLKEAGTLDVKF